jgi:hypothetical protein
LEISALDMIFKQIRRIFANRPRSTDMKNYILLILLFFTAFTVNAQSFKVYGKVTNNKLEPLAFANIQLKEQQSGIMTKEDGSYEMNLEVGQYTMVISIIGYKTQVVNLLVNKDYEQNIILDEDTVTSTMEDVVIRFRVKDRSEEIMRNVIRNKDNITSASPAYSAKVYIKAIQQDSATRKRDRGKIDSMAFHNPDADLQGMAMTEVLLHVDYSGSNKLKEERLGVTSHGNAANLFYLSATDGDFSFYNNLIKVPSISETPFLSPVSYSGLLAYKFKMIKTERKDGHRIFTISVKPRQISNATVEGEITILDSTWAILHTRFSFPQYHLPEFDFFEVDQQYEFVQNKAWMITRQQFNYYQKAGAHRLSGQTLVTYSDYELNKNFERNHFGTEVSATAQTAYEKDSSFWQTVRTTPLTDKEVRLIRFRDSIFRATHTVAYLDSIDRVNNRITLPKLGIFGQTFYNRAKERTIVLPPLIALYEPFQFGGGRIHPAIYYYKRYTSKKDITFYADLSYGLRNHDINGSVRLKRMYNPFNRGYYKIELNRDFDMIYSGDAWINQVNRSNYFMNNYFALAHGLEVANGLYVHTEIDYALRRSLVGYETNPKADSILDNLGGVFANSGNQPKYFDPFNAAYGRITVKYTPGQKYIREPKEKVILGSKWPTVFVTLNKGFPSIFNSKADFDYLEFGLEQEIHLGLLGNLRYTVKSGKFITQRDLKLLDYHWERRGDPFLFMNPDEAFQALDSTFPLFQRFYQAHAVHEFNGALINKIPLLKKLQLREILGGGFLIAPERDLKYAELFAGIERVFKWPFNPLTKFKLGVYVVGSVANQFNNPIQFKVGLTTWDKKRNKWK